MTLTLTFYGTRSRLTQRMSRRDRIELLQGTLDLLILRILQEQLEERNVKIELTDEAREWLADKGFDPAFGARPMGRTVETHMKKPLAEAILFGELKNGGKVRFDVNEAGDDLVWTKIA